MAIKNKMRRAEKKSKNSLKFLRKSFLGPWLSYLASLLAFTGFCYTFSQREFTSAVGLGVLSLIFLFIPLIVPSSFKKSLDSWNTAYTPPNLLKDQTVHY